VNDFVGVKDLIVMATRQRMLYPDQAMKREILLHPAMEN